jgi:FkbM family methyltransferase
MQTRFFLKGTNLVVYDIGAAKGNFTTMMAKMSKVGKIYAFEPLPESFKKLENRSRPYSKIDCFNLALGNTNGKSHIYESDHPDSSSLLPFGELNKIEFPNIRRNQKREIQVARLDDLVKEQQLSLPNFVKIDVQGFENLVLIGGENTIRHAQYCMLEMSLLPLYEGSPLFDDLYQMMKNFGFAFKGVLDQIVGKSGQILQIDCIFENNTNPKNALAFIKNDKTSYS